MSNKGRRDVCLQKDVVGESRRWLAVRGSGDNVIVPGDRWVLLDWLNFNWRHAQNPQTTFDGTLFLIQYVLLLYVPEYLPPATVGIG